MNWNRNIEEMKLRSMIGDKFESFVDRRDTGVPETFVPSARGLAIAGPILMCLTYHRAHSGMFGGWLGREPEGLYKTVARDDYVLSVRRHDGWAGGEDLWSVERLRLGEKIFETLAFDFGPTPIFLRCPITAKHIAKHCHPYPKEDARYLRWIPSTGEVARNSIAAGGESVWRA
jgi:hypothetical protein